MNKYLMLSAAAVFSSVTAAQAGIYCWQFGSSGGGSFCDGATLYTGVDGGAFGGSVRAWQHTNNNCAGGISHGYGVVGKTPGLGKVSIMSDDLFAQNYGIFNTAVAFQLPNKIKNGQPWALWLGFNGTTFFQANSGTLSNVTKCGAGAMNHGRKSTVASVMEMIRAHRSAKAGPATTR